MLTNDLLERGGNDIALVLDDYHVITAEAIQRGMIFLLEHALPARPAGAPGGDGVTVVCSVELAALFSPVLELPEPLDAIADGVDNLLFLRYVELQSQLYRLLSILKMRESGYDSAIREFRITEQGIDVAPTFESAQAILTGVALPAGRQQRTAPFASAAERARGERP